MHRKNRLTIIYTAVIIPSLFFILFDVAEASGSLTVTPPSPSATVVAGTAVTFTVTPSGFTNPIYLVDDNFGGTSLSSGNINSSGSFSWTPTANDVGTHSFTITATDGLGSAANATIILSVSQPSITLGTPQPSASVNAGGSVSFNSVVSGLSNPSYILSDNFGGSSLSSTNISNSGYVSWSPLSQDVGTHSITVTARDSYGHTLSAIQTITVNSAPSLMIQSLSPGATISPNQAVSFSVTQTGMTNPAYIVSDSFIPNTVTNSNINSLGNFSWTPTVNETGTHNLFIIVTDSATGRSQSITQTITVLIPNVTIAGASGSLASPGKTVSFGVSVNGFTNPTYTLSDSFVGGTAASANISSNGYFSWTPTVKDIGSHTLTINVADAYGHSGTVSQTILIQNASITIQSIYPSLSIAVGTPLSFTLQPLNFTNPTYTLVDSFSGITSMFSSNINSYGNFSWTPKEGDAGVHTVHIYANDSSAHSASTTLTVVVGGINAPLISADIANAQYRFTHPIIFGAKGNEVKELQKRLTKLGFFSGPVNGTFGPLTRAAVKRFQAKHHLEQLGNVGPGTRAALNIEQ